MTWCTHFFISHYILYSDLLFLSKIINWKIALLLLKKKIFFEFLLESISSLPVFRILFAEYWILKLSDSFIFIFLTFYCFECICLENLVIVFRKTWRILVNSKDGGRRYVAMTEKSELLRVILVMEKNVRNKRTRPAAQIIFNFELLTLTSRILTYHTMFLI